jgi:hypothetical protein
MDDNGGVFMFFLVIFGTFVLTASSCDHPITAAEYSLAVERCQKNDGVKKIWIDKGDQFLVICNDGMEATVESKAVQE